MSQAQKESKPEVTYSNLDPITFAVDTAMLHSSIMIPGTGRTESTLNQVKVPGIKMEWIRNEGLLIEARGRKTLIPSANVKCAHLKK